MKAPDGATVTLGALLKGLVGKMSSETSALRISGVEDDSRRVTGGELFVCVRGESADGHAFAAEAARRGAAAVLAERAVALPRNTPVVTVPDTRVLLPTLAARFYGDPSKRLRVIGVTGTAGKTTTVYILRHVLSACGVRTAMLGTVVYDTHACVYPAPNTTPGVLLLNRLLRESLDAGCSACAMEVSSHALVQGRTSGVRFHSGVLTSLASDHLDYHGDAASYRAAKRRLFEPESTRSLAVLNAAAPHRREFERVASAPVVTYLVDVEESGRACRDALVRARVRARDTRRSEGVVLLAGEEIPFDLPMPGLHNVENALAALCVAHFGFGLDTREAADALADFDGVPGRLERVTPDDHPFDLFVDFAHTENALEAALSALRPLVRGRLIAVFGCGGDRDRSKRSKMGAVAERLADFSIITSDNPRSEKPERIIAEILEGMRGKDRLRVEVDRRAAIEAALRAARSDDVILVAGKGHESVQIFSDRIEEFDDRQVVKELLNGAA